MDQSTEQRTNDERTTDAGIDERAAATVVFAGSTEMQGRCRDHDWAATALGPVADWPVSLRTIAASVVATGFPCALLWGPQRFQLYNDAYIPFLGVMHPSALGRPTHEIWPELRDVTEPSYARVDAGETLTFTDQPYALRRRGPDAPPDDVFLTVTYAPVRDESGAVAGLTATFFETTAEARARRQGERLLAASHTVREELEASNAQLGDQQMEVELSNERLQEQAAELEAQSNELAEALDKLGERTRESEVERARAIGILESMADAYFALDADFRVTAVNGMMERGSGLAREQLLGHSFWTLFPGSVGTAFEHHYRRAVVDGIPAHFTHDYSDGRLELVVEVDAYPRPGGGVAVFWRDATGRLRAERALRDSEAKYRGLFDTMDQGFCVIEMLFDDGRPVDYRFLDANPAFERQTGLVDALGRTARELVPTLEAHWFELYGRVATTGEPTRFQQGSEPMARWFDVYAFRIGLPEEHRVAVLFTDVSAAKIAERERERLYRAAETARAEAEAANRAKAEFLAVMSHELRTPLNAINGHAELIEMGIHGPVSPGQRQALARIQTSQRHLLGLINGVLNYARVEAGAVNYHLADVPVKEVLDTCEALTAPLARRSQLTLHYDGCPPELVVRADPEKLQQIVLNLLSNAVKFTDPGGRVALTCGPASSADGPRVAIQVTDTGHGIPPEQLERVFEPFVQIDARFTRAQDGTGLGLAISRDLARGMGGDLTVESEPGVGSTFTLLLPAG